MKTLRNILIIMLSIGLIMSCSKPDTLSENNSNVLKKYKAEPKTVTVPFEANLLGQITNLVSDNPECADGGFAYRVVVETSGKATHMGKVSLTFDFCTAGPPDPNIPGSFYTYAASSSEMIAANGDKLFLGFGGSSGILGRTDDHPDYVTDYWRDTVTINGGTGRFEGASGKLLLNDYCTNIDDYTHHHLTGTITLVKGKR